MSQSILTYTATALLAVTTLAVPATAQEDPNLTGVAPALQEPDGEEGFGAYGSGSQDTWIAATEFTGKLSSTAPSLSYASFHYYTAAGVANQRYFAQIPLPSGAQIQVIQCYVNDASAVNNVTLGYQVYDHDLTSNSPGAPMSPCPGPRRAPRGSSSPR